MVVAPGIHWARLSLPFRLNHINVWLIEGDDGLTIIDTGIADNNTPAQWECIVTASLAPRGVARIVATHHHPDHCGLLGWMSARFGAPVAMSRNEWLSGQFYLRENDPILLAASESFYRRAGYPAGQFDGSQIPFTSLTQKFPTQYQRLIDGETIFAGGAWTVMTFGGHAPELVCLYSEERKILIASDQVLPAISPIIAIAPHEPEENPLDEFLKSLEALKRLPADTLVLPSHGMPYLALHVRLDALLAHHQRRLGALSNALDVPRNAAMLTARLFPEVPQGFDRIFALGETLAHIRYLERRGEVRRSADSGGVDYFQRVG